MTTLRLELLYELLTDYEKPEDLLGEVFSEHRLQRRHVQHGVR